MPGAYEAMMRDPSGGNPIYQDRMLDLPVLGIDIGVGLGGRWAMKKLTPFGTRHARGVAEAAISHAERNLATTTAGYVETAAHPWIQMHKLDADKAAARATFKAERRAVKGGYAKLGTSFRRLGLAAAGLGIFDAMLSLGMHLTTPGVSRETLEKDRAHAFGDEMLDTRAAYTQRQRSLQAIHDSQLSVGRALIGQEARYLHR